MTKKILLTLIVCTICCSWGQTNFYWLNTAPDGNWRQGAAGARWWDGTTGLSNEPGYGILHFDNNHQLTMTNNVAGTYNQHAIIFDAGNTNTRTIGGNAVQFFDFGSTWARIRNYSTVNHNVNFPIINGNCTDCNIRFIATEGALTFGGTVTNNFGRGLFINGNNTAVDGTNRFIRFNNVISGSGFLTVSERGVGILNAANIYTGETRIDHGELWIAENGDIAAGSAIYLGNGGQQANVTKFFLADADGGQNFTRAININQGNTNTRYIGSLNTSGTNTLSGTIAKNSGTHLFIEVPNAGGTLQISGGVASGSSGNTVKLGTGTLRVSTNSLNGAANGGFFIRDGTVEVDVFPLNLLATIELPIIIGDDGLGVLRILDSNTNYNGNITVNANNGRIEFNSSNNRSFTGNIEFSNNTLTLVVQSEKNLILNGNQLGTGILHISSTGTGAVMLTRTVYNRTGNTFINSGELRLNPNFPGIIFNSKVLLNGGILSTTGITVNRAFTSSAAFQLSSSSSIQLEANAHNIIFANSSSESWSGTLTINGWTGTPSALGSGINGRIYFGTDNTGLSAAQLSNINFIGFAPGAVITDSGELVPSDYPTFYSTGSVAPNALTNWKSEPDGTGFSPTNFTSRATFVIQNGHTMTTTDTWTAGGANSLLQIENDGTLIASHTVTIHTTGTFQIDNGGTYIHDNTGTTIFRGTENFGNSSTVIYRQFLNFNAIHNISYGHVTIDSSVLGTNINLNGNLQTVNGNFTILNTNNQQVRLSSAGSTLTVGGDFVLNGATAHFVLKHSTNAGNQTMIVNGNVDLPSGILTFTNSASGGHAYLVAQGTSVTISQNLAFAGTLAGNSGFYLDRNVEQTLNIAHPFTSDNQRNRFYVSTENSQPINEVYNGVAAQETINGNGAAPSAGWAAWPTSGTTIKNFTVINTSPNGVTLRDDRMVNNILTLTDGLLFTGACDVVTSGTPLLTMAAGSSLSGGGAHSYVSGVMRKIGHTAFTFPLGGNGKYAPLHITSPGTATDQYTACYIKTDATFGTTQDINVRNVSTCEHWVVNRTEAVSTGINLSLNYDDSDVCKPVDCYQIVHLNGTVWKNIGIDTAFGPTYLTSEPITSSGVFTWASGAIPVHHVDPLADEQSTKIGFGTHDTMREGFPTNIPSGFIAFDTKSKGFVIPRIGNSTNRPTGAEGLLIYYEPDNCIQLFRDNDWRCISAVCE